MMIQMGGTIIIFIINYEHQQEINIYYEKSRTFAYNMKPSNLLVLNVMQAMKI